MIRFQDKENKGFVASLRKAQDLLCKSTKNQESILLIHTPQGLTYATPEALRPRLQEYYRVSLLSLESPILSRLRRPTLPTHSRGRSLLRLLRYQITSLHSS